ncbi:uncharacterized protein LOC125775361 [Bactrocera dorsalis]|uniref:Uncharacterized protein LOC125775361 n=1 Tax=Bactrocera dorsalis TaxID=27457 RepID=A0ABM3IXW8_BACDO|nr:uncharacterized protein LOC125775361 [Bactrocera dorsalis]
MDGDSKESKSTQYLKVQKMTSEEKSPCTPADSTRSKQGATKQKKMKDISYTKFIAESDSLIRYCTRFSSSPIQDNSESVLEIKKENVSNFWTRLQAAYAAIVESDESDLPENFKSSAYSKYEHCLDQYEETRAMISDKLRLFKAIAPTPQPRVELPQVQIQEASSGIHLKVPACDTEIFHGGYEQWPSFRDMFTAVYINHPKLSNAQKLYHLRYKTKGQAGVLVKQFALNDENFNYAWEALKARYENERILVDKQVTILMNLPKIQKETSEEFIKLQSTVSNCLSVLATQNIPTDNWDPILVNICTSALPEKSLLLWEQSLSSRRKCPTWQQMNDFLTSLLNWRRHRLRDYSRVNNRAPVVSSFRYVAPIGYSKRSQVLLHLVLPTEWRSSSSSASPGGYCVEYFQSWSVFVHPDNMT